MSDDLTIALTELPIAELTAELARRAADQGSADSSAARAQLASGAVGDVGAPDVHPMTLAKQAINDGLTKRHLSHEDSLALGVAQIMNAAIKGDSRVNYVGRTAPGV